MYTPHQDALIVAKLEDAIRQIGETIEGLKSQRAQGEPDAKVERKYFASQLNAYKRALSNWDRGLRPRAFGNGYLVPSGSTPGKAPYYVERRGDVWVCDPTCPHCGDSHWHTAIVAVLALCDQADDGEVITHAPVELPAFDAWQLPDYDEPWLPAHTATERDPEQRSVVAFGARRQLAAA
mgnify:CR=1 FL=1